MQQVNFKSSWTLVYLDLLLSHRSTIISLIVYFQDFIILGFTKQLPYVNLEEQLRIDREFFVFHQVLVMSIDDRIWICHHTIIKFIIKTLQTNNGYYWQGCFLRIRLKKCNIRIRSFRFQFQSAGADNQRCSFFFSSSLILETKGYRRLNSPCMSQGSSSRKMVRLTAKWKTVPRPLYRFIHLSNLAV